MLKRMGVILSDSTKKEKAERQKGQFVTPIPEVSKSWIVKEEKGANGSFCY
ncbi:hypothetical protein [Aeromonas hydrophila]|uniref:hypothetical protein n=1 Tax=Aeromonas hydrophila TaxID=644 RepID=UPI002B470EAB|nr:hypothetical protein [Aeromonas hydrophila]